MNNQVYGITIRVNMADSKGQLTDVESAVKNLGKSAAKTEDALGKMGSGLSKLSAQSSAAAQAEAELRRLNAAAAEFARTIARQQNVNLGKSNLGADMKAQADKVTAAFRGMEVQVVASTKRVVSALGTLYAQGTKTLKGLEPHVRTLGAAFNLYFTARFATTVVKTADAFTEMSARLKLVSGTTNELVTAQTRLFQIAQATRTPVEDLGRQYNRMALAIKNLGGSQEQVLRQTELVSKALKISGATTAESTAALLQWSQAMGGVALNGDEFRSVVENMPRAIQALTEYTGKSIGQLREMSAQGQITPEMMMKAMEAAGDKIDKEFSQIPKTVAGAWVQVQNAFKQYIGTANEAGGGSHKLAESLGLVADNLNEIIDPLAKVVAFVAKVEVGGWLALQEALKEINIKLREMVGLKAGGVIDPEIVKLMKYGSGSASVAEIAGRPSASASGILAEGKRFLGMTESKANGADTLIKYLNENSGTTYKDIAGRANAWCARFVSAVLESSGVLSEKSASAAAYKHYGTKVWQKKDGVQDLAKVQPGDIAVFSRTGGHHVAFVDSVDLTKGTLKVLGGNQGGKDGGGVTLSERTIKDLLVVRRAPGVGSPLSETQKPFFDGKNLVDENLKAATANLTEVQRYIVKASMKAMLDPAIMLGLAQRESNFVPDQVSKIKGKGYAGTGVGVYQFIPETGERYGLKPEDRTDYKKNIDAGVKMFNDLLKQVGSYATSQEQAVRLALAAMNMGPGSYRKDGKGVLGHLARGENPEKFTEGPHVQRALENAAYWKDQLGGSMSNLVGVMDESAIKKANDQFKKILDEQFESHKANLKRMEEATDGHNKTELSNLRVQMEQLEADRAKALEKQKASMAQAQALGDPTVVAKLNKEAMAAETAYLEHKKKLTLEGMKLEQAALQQRLANTNKLIQEAPTIGQGAQLPELEAERTKIMEEMTQLANQRKELEIRTQTEITQARTQSEQELRRQQAQTASDWAAQQEQVKEGLRIEMDLRQKAAAAGMMVMEDVAATKKAEIDSTIAAAKLQAEQAEAQRQMLLDEKTGAEAIAVARDNINAKLADSVRLADLERDATFQKLDEDRKVLELKREIAYWEAQAVNVNDMAGQIAAKQKLLEIEQELLKNQREYGDAIIVAEQAKAKAATTAATDSKTLTKGAEEQRVADEQLRLNQAFEDGVRNAQLFAEQATAAFGDVGTAIGKLVVGFAQYNQQVYQAQRDRDNAIKGIEESMAKGVYSESEGFAKIEEEKRKEIQKTAQLQIQMYGDMASAAKSFFKEGSKGYQAMANAEKVFRAFQMAMAIKQVAVQVMGNTQIMASDTARTATEIANSQARGQTKSAEALANQGSGGDVWTAFPRIAAMAAIMAAIGFSVAGATSASASTAMEDRQKAIGTGTVFGDSAAKSESLSKSLDIVAENSSADLAYSAGMLRSLKNIELNMKGVTNSIITGVVPNAGGAKLGRLSSFDPGMEAIGILKRTRKITDYGLAFDPAELSSILKGALTGRVYTELTTETKALGMVLSRSVKTVYSSMSDEITDQFTRTVVSIADGMKAAGKAFGLTSDDFNKNLKGFIVDFGMISTKGLKGQELQDAVSAMFSKMSDQMARAFLPGLDEFQQAGEGYAQTVFRVADGINVATGMMDQLGIATQNFQDIVLKQGDVAAELVRISLVAFAGAGSVIGKYLDQAVGSAEELIKVFEDLSEVSDIATTVGMQFGNLSNEMIVAAGGVNAFLNSLQTYQSEFFGQGAEYASQVTGLRREFNRLNLEMPKTKAEFIRLVEGIDTSTVAGQKLYAQVIKLADGFSKAAKAAADIDALRQKYGIEDPLKKYRDQLTQVTTDYQTIVDAEMAKTPGFTRLNTQYRKRDAYTTDRSDAEVDRVAKQAELDRVKEEIAVLQAKGKLTVEEKKRLAKLKTERAALRTDITAISEDIDFYSKQIKNLDKAIQKNPKNAAYLAERQKLIEEQGNAILKTIADIWDQMVQNINAAKETLITIKNQIFELTSAAGSADIKLGMSTARRVTAEEAYNSYTGNDIVKLNKLANDYYSAIMDEYNAKMALIEEPKKALEKERDLRQKAHDQEVDALEKQLATTKELFDAVLNIQQYVKNLRLSSASTLSPKALLDQAQKQYEETLIKAQGGDVQAMRDITGASDAYLEAAKKYFGSGGKYGSIFDDITTSLDKLGLTDVGDAQTIQDKIDQLNKDHEKYLKSIDDQIEAMKIDEQIKDLQTKTAEKLDMLAKDLGPRITKAEEQAQKDMQTLVDQVKDGNLLNQKQLDALNEMLKGWGMAAVENPNPPEPTLPEPTDGWVQKLYEEWLKKQTGYTNPLPAFASGGMASAGWALVGEEGPELVKFGGQAMVYDAEKTKQLLASFQPIPSQGGKKINLETLPRVVDDIRKPNNPPAKLYTDEVVAELRTLQREVKALVTTQSGANPQLISELATLNRRMETIERQQRIKV